VLHIQYQTGAFGQHPAICLLPYWIKRSVPNPPKIVVTAHDLLLPYLFPKAGPLRNWVTYRLLADADAVIVTNQEDEIRLREGGDPPAATELPIYRGRALPPDAQIRRIPIGSNIAVAPPPGYTRAAWRARLGVAPHETLVAYFGLISPTKGLDTLVQALEQLPATRLLVIGGDAITPQDQAYAAQVRNSIVTAGLSVRVTMTGHCGAEEVSAHLLAADLAALPFTDGASFRRGSLLATLAHGLPTITTTPPNQAAPDQLVDGRSVLLTAPSNPTALADAIRRLAADSPLRMRLAAAARDLAQQFSWERIAESHGELYGML
jgi:glycosyltransferase involved in cell wall biosynthesis